MGPVSSPLTHTVLTDFPPPLSSPAGVVFVTSRIFVVDLLMERLPASAISGIVVANAHRVTNLSTEAFILRLYRHANRTGFVKALSDHAQGFTGGFNAVEKV